jgi:hypothetical protein
MILKINGDIVAAKFENGVIDLTYEFSEACDKMEFMLHDEQDRPSIIRYIYEPVQPGDVVDLSWADLNKTIEITEEDIYEKRLQYEPLTIKVGKRRWIKLIFYKTIDF